MPDLIPVANDPFVDPPSMLVPVDHDPFATPKPGMTVPPADVGQAAARLPGQIAQGAWNASGLGDVYNTIRRGGTWTDVAGASVPLAMGMMAPEERGITAAEEAAAPALKGITAYHGSPYDFDRFDLSKIGTGEGAQAFGHGLYFAEAEPVAKQYRDQLGGKTIGGEPIGTSPEHQAAAALAQSGRDAAIRYFDRRIGTGRDVDTATAAKRLLETNAPLPQVDSDGKMYQVNIAADPEHFLDWDKPLSEQSPQVKAALANAGVKPIYQVVDKNGGKFIENNKIFQTLNPDEAAAFAAKKKGSVKEFSAGDLLHGQSQGSPEDISIRLSQAGIPGIKYFDQGSRMWTSDAAQARAAQIQRAMEQSPSNGSAADNARIAGLQKELASLKAGPTHNYVVFDDNLINIIRKYGLAGLIAGGASHFSTTPVDHNPFQQ